MSKVPHEFQEILLSVTHAFEVQRSLETIQQLSPEAFGVMFGLDTVGDSPTADQTDAAIDDYNVLLDEWDDKARQTFGEIRGYHLRQVESGRLAIAKRLGQSSVWGPKLRETVLTAEVEPDSQKLILSKVTQYGRECEIETVDKADKKTLSMAVLALLKVIGPVES
ncbi:MAG: hypothetical protein ACREGB_01375 [Candidatus Saccharimonadales bacterium]